MHDQNRENRIRERAHSLWQAAGSPEGEHDVHWLQAEQEIGNGSDETQGESAIEPVTVPDLDPVTNSAASVEVRKSEPVLVKSDIKYSGQADPLPASARQR